MKKTTIITLGHLLDSLEDVEDVLIELGAIENEKLDRDIEAEPEVGEPLSFGDTLIHFAEQLGNEIRLPLEELLDEERIKK